MGAGNVGVGHDKGPRVAEAQAAGKVEVGKGKAGSPTLAKGAMRKVMVVQDDSDDDEASPPPPPPTAAALHPASSANPSKAPPPTAAGLPGMLGMPGLPGAGSPEDMKSAAEFAQRMAVMMQDPAIQKSLKNPRVQAVMPR